MVTLISSISTIEHLILLIQTYNPSKIFILQNQSRKEKEIIKILNESFAKVISIKYMPFYTLDIITLTKKIVDVIEKQDEVIVNIYTNDTIQSLSLVYACYIKPEHIKHIITYYTDELLELPILSFNLSNTKKNILKQIQKGEKSVSKISNTLKISRGMIYNHIRELKEHGYLKQDLLELTIAGELAIL